MGVGVGAGVGVGVGAGVGVGVGGGITAETALNRLRRPPDTHLPARAGMESVVFIRTCLIWAPVRVLQDAAYTRAAAPATWGVAMLVPLMVLYEPRATGQVLRMLDPGAPMSTVVLKRQWQEGLRAWELR